MVQTIPVAVDG